MIIEVGDTNYLLEKQNGLWVFSSEKPFCKTPFCARLSRTSAKAAGGWNKIVCLQPNNCLWVLWYEWKNNGALPFLWNRKSKAEQHNNFYRNDLYHQYSVQESWEKGVSVDTMVIMILKTMKDKELSRGKSLKHWKACGTIHSWFSFSCQWRKGAQCTLLFELLSLRQTRFIHRIFDLKTNMTFYFLLL